MAEKNKVLKNYLKNRLIGSCLVFSMFVAFFWAADSNTVRQELNLPKHTNANTSMNIMIKIIITLACLLMFSAFTSETKESANKKFSDLTKKYLDYVSKTYPSATRVQVQEIMNNPAALQQLCTFICNSLTEQDQEEIVKLVCRLDYIYTKPVSKQKMKEIPVKKAQIEEEFVNIVKKRVVINDDVIKSLIQKNIICFNTKDNLQR